MIAPSGRLKAKKRDFHQVVFDLRHVVFTVIRERQMPTGNGGAALGTGFFVSPEIFITCDHVINGVNDPHQDGDTYMLVANLTGTSGTVYRLEKPTIGKEINLFPNLDLAVLRVQTQSGQPYVALEYGDVYEGTEVGVVGYPIPELRVVNGNLQLDGLVYRAGKGYVTGRYTTNVDAAITNVPIVEVNFLFVPGNSGGPVFSAETGRVLGFVRGFRYVRIHEEVATVQKIKQLPLGLGNEYIANLNAVYSLAFKLDFIRATIEGFGVTL
jgi:hypothetical protein